MRDKGNTEVGGFCISSKEDLLLIEDVVLIPQKCTSVTVEFTDDGIADYVDDMVDQEFQPEQFFRVWWHTHPGMSPDPSGVDEETFARVFGECNWSVMFILASDDRCYARIQIKTPVEGSFVIPVQVISESVSRPEWEEEYDENVTVAVNKFFFQGKYGGKYIAKHGGQVFQAGEFGADDEDEDIDLWGDDDWRRGDWAADCLAVIGDGDAEIDSD